MNKLRIIILALIVISQGLLSGCEEKIETNINDNDNNQQNESNTHVTTSFCLYPIADTYVSSDELTTNYGNDITLDVRFWDYDNEDKLSNSYLLFNLSNISSNKTTTKATLRLFVWSAWSPSAEVGVYRCFNISWIENDITWNNSPSFTYASAVTQHIDSEYQWYDFDVTNIVKNAIQQHEGKISFVLKIQDTGDSYMVRFNSKESSNNHPELIIELS